jgi:hypothetical protein
MKERRRKRFVIVGKSQERKSTFQDFFYIYYLKGQCLRGSNQQGKVNLVNIKNNAETDGKRSF